MPENFGLTSLSAGWHTLRNEKGWRDNEIEIDYIWICKIKTAFAGSLGIITLKYERSEFRQVENLEKLVQGIFVFDSEDNLTGLYTKTQNDEFYDHVRQIEGLELFTANTGVTLDGVSYEYNIIASNIESHINVSNPNSQQWKKWEREVWNLANKLGENSNNAVIKHLLNQSKRTGTNS